MLPQENLGFVCLSRLNFGAFSKHNIDLYLQMKGHWGQHKFSCSVPYVVVVPLPLTLNSRILGQGARPCSE